MAALLSDFEPQDRSTRRPRGRLVAVAVVVVAAVLTCVLVVALIGAGRSKNHTIAAAQSTTAASSTSASPGGTAAPTEQAAALAWLRKDLPSSTPIAGPASMADQLRRAGFTDVRVQVSTTLPAGTSYVVSAAGTTSTLPTRSTPVAVFGTGAEQVTVAAVGSSSETADQRRASTTARRSAGRQLSTNPQLTITDSARAALRAGRVDLRAATALALLCQRGDVTLDALPQDAAERRAQLPIRSMIVTVAQASTVQSVTSMLPGAYRVEKVTARPHRRTLLQWPVSGRTAMPVG